MDLRPGLKVRLHGLVAAPELNGITGQLQSFHKERERWAVVVPGSTAPKLLKAQNLEALVSLNKDEAAKAAASSDPSNAGKSDSATAAPCSQAAPEILPAAAKLTAAVKITQSSETCPVNLEGGICRYINLDRRDDRRTALEALVAKHASLSSALKRVPAVDGKDLDWRSLVSGQKITPQACMEAEMAERMQQPTMNVECPEECSPHLTLGGCGCALSHLKAWKELLSSGSEWALIMEDDVCNLCNDFDSELRLVLSRLPSGWQVCYLGYHTRAGAREALLPSGKHVQGPCRMPPDSESWLPGLYCYLISIEGAKKLVSKVVPFASQVDLAFGSAASESGQCYALEVGNFLAFSQPTEVSRDTDIQTFPKKK